MSHLIAIAYPDERQALTLFDELKRLQSDGTISLESAVAIVKDREGGVRVETTDGASLGKGAVGGLLLGTVLGVILLAPVAGALFGAAGGALVGKLNEIGKIDEFGAQVSESIPAGSSAILLVAQAQDPEQGLAILSRHGGKVIRTSLPDDAEARLRAALA